MNNWSRTFLTLGLTVGLTCGLAAAIPIGAAGSGSDVVMIDDTVAELLDNQVIVLWNLSTSSGDVTVEYLSTNPVADVAEGYCLLDGTLRVTTNLPEGEYRMLVARAYDRTRARVEEREHGLRRNTLQIMRRASDRPRHPTPLWAPARCLDRPRGDIERARSAPQRQLRNKERGHLGRRGIDPTATVVWTVTDNASDFAVGGLIPEPVALTGMLVVGAGLLIKRRFKRA